ncbi:MAG: hypothetical protein H8E43_05430 [Planctomycetia bacterium]|nr:hypothetical protein [Planctomycetia bacterium]MBL6914027.1 hypothetical protein [Planctomycetota bacterium]
MKSMYPSPQCLATQTTEILIKLSVVCPNIDVHGPMAYYSKMKTTWHELISGNLDILIEAAQSAVPDDVQTISRLRKKGSLEQVSTVLELLEARRRARGRLSQPDEWWIDREGAEQATRSIVAEHKSRRVREVSGEQPIIDLCCGIGSDALALSKRGPVILVDHDPLKLLLASANLRHFSRNKSHDSHLVIRAKAENLPLAPLPIHIDPARRSETQRLHAYSEMQPGPAVIESIIEHHRDVALKCGPGVSADDLPAGEIEWIQDGPDLVEATLWCGQFDGGNRRRATLVKTGLSVSGNPIPLEELTLKTPQFLHEPVPVLERSGLTGHLQADLAAGELHPGLGWLAGQDHKTSPWFRSFEVVDRLGWHEKKVIDWFKARGEAPRAIKTRGVKEDPAALGRKFPRKKGDWTLALLRRGTKIEAWILQELK